VRCPAPWPSFGSKSRSASNSTERHALANPDPLRPVGCTRSGHARDVRDDCEEFPICKFSERFTHRLEWAAETP
jgi:hypothetical protein